MIDKFYIATEDIFGGTGQNFGILLYKKGNIYKLVNKNHPASPYFICEENITESVCGIVNYKFGHPMLIEINLAEYREKRINEILND